MPYIKVNAIKISGYANSANSSYVKVNRIKSEFSSVGNSLDWDVKSGSDIKKRIQSIERELNAEAACLKKMQVFFSATAKKYNEVENKICGDNRVKKTSKMSGKVAAIATIKSDSNETVVEKLKKLLVEKAGLAGGYIAAITSTIQSISNTDTGGVVKGCSKIIKCGYEIVNNVSKLEKLHRMDPGLAVRTGFKRLIGLNKAFTGALRPSIAKNFGTRFYNNFQKQLSDRIGAYGKKGAKSVFSWAGVVVTGIANGFQNFNEAKDGKISTGRAVAETITETVIDVGGGILIGAAVSAGIAAAGFVAAPAAAVGLATGAVIVGADALFKWVTKSDNGLTETVSDFVLDTGTNIIKGGAKIVSGAVKEVGNIGKSIGNFFSKVF